MDHLTEGQKQPHGIAEEPTYRCPDCLDHAYRSRIFTARGDVCQVAWFCDCEAGRAAQAGYWFETIYERSGNTRVHSDRGQKKLAEYLAAKPLEKRFLPAAIEHQRGKHEEQRRRKLAALEAGES